VSTSINAAAFRHDLGTLCGSRGSYDTNICSPHWMGRSIRCWSVAARRGAASGHAEHPAFTDGSGRAITANQPHAPPR
jgi:hypothetical protein